MIEKSKSLLGDIKNLNQNELEELIKTADQEAKAKNVPGWVLPFWIGVKCACQYRLERLPWYNAFESNEQNQAASQAPSSVGTASSQQAEDQTAGNASSNS